MQAQDKVQAGSRSGDAAVFLEHPGFLCFDSPTTAIQVCSFGGAHILTHTHMAKFCRDRNPSSPHHDAQNWGEPSQHGIERFAKNFGEFWIAQNLQYISQTQIELRKCDARPVDLDGSFHKQRLQPLVALVHTDTATQATQVVLDQLDSTSFGHLRSSQMKKQPYRTPQAMGPEEHAFAHRAPRGYQRQSEASRPAAA